MKSVSLFALVSISLSIPAGAAKFFVLEATDVPFTGHPELARALQQNVPMQWGNAGSWGNRRLLSPAVRVPAPNEAYLGRLRENDERPGVWRPQGELRLAIRVEGKDPVEGFIDLRHPDQLRLLPFRFRIDPSKHEGVSEADFDAIRRAHYRRLASSRIPGSAWFRHLGHDPEREAPPEEERRVFNDGDLGRTFAMFSGGRAIAENLALDRELILARAEGAGADVPIDGIAGITVPEIEWKERLPDDPVATDPLAGALPLDQYALFLPSLGALFELADLVEQQGAPVVQSFEIRNSFHQIPTRYMKQLGIGDRAAVLKLPIRTVAITGGDPFLPTGSDIAVLLESENAQALFASLAEIIEAAAAKAGGVEPMKIEGEGFSQRGFRNAARTFSSHLIRRGEHLALTNSRAQAHRLLEVWSGASPSLGSADEFAFFRHRYPLADDRESAFLFLSDPAIRRWCGPRIRIGASRRARALAAMGELTARRLTGAELGDEFAPLLGAVGPARRHGVRSERFGSTDFVTPVGELDLEKVTATEKAAYERWRRGYQNGWRRVFDPIAIRLAAAEDKIDLDLTVLPLTVGSDYREWIAMAGKATLSPMAQHPHDESLLFLSFAVDSQSEPFREFDTQLGDMMPGLRVNPLAWVDESVTVFFERDYFWTAHAKAEDGGDFIMQNISKLPIGLRVESNSSIKLALFLTGLRGLAESSAPDLLRWDKRKHGKRSYIALIGNEEEIGTSLTIYYAALPKALLVTLDEDLVKRAIDREAKGGELPAGDGGEAQHAFMQADPQVLQQLGSLMNNVSFSDARRLQSWSAIPVLNEWRRGGSRSPARVHQETFGIDIHCPGGKGYRWNAAAMTMESVAYGHPAAPRDEALPIAIARRFGALMAGLSFEDDGLRLRASLGAKKPTPGQAPRDPGEQLATAAALVPPPGATLEFKSAPPGFDFTLETLEPGKRDGRPTRRTRSVFEREEGTSSSTYEEILDDEGLKIVAHETEDELSLYHEPQLQLPAILYAGATTTREFAYDIGEGEDTMSISGQVTIRPVARESVSVAAGNFDDCVRVETTSHTLSNEMLTKQRSTLWFKEGIGLVKSTGTGDLTHRLELVDYEIPKPE